MADISTLIISKIKETFSRHKTRIDLLEERVSALERRVLQLESETANPWKMPFD